jgi:protein-S-isoprenylcysteine O-methyltransferase Ste14
MALKIIQLCWGIFVVLWVFRMFTNKRTVERLSRVSRWQYSIFFVLAFWLLFWRGSRHFHDFLAQVVVPEPAALQALAVALVIAGLGVAIWARMVLGRNWNGAVTFKEEHELIERGPYAFVRHPIYTGMLLMFLGTALATGTRAGLLGWPLLWLSFRIKYRQEEALMIGHFGDRYRAYRRRVRALVPFVF